MSDFAARAGRAGRPVSSVRMYRDPHEGSLTLVVLGAVLIASETIQLVWPVIPFFADWATAAALTVAFGGLWLEFRGRASSRGRKYPPGFGIAAIIGLAIILPPLLFLLVFAGPFLLFGPSLVTAGLSLHNRLLTVWGAAIGALGVFEGFFGITNRLPTTIWADWEHSAIYLTLGIATLAAGVIAWAREAVRPR